MRWKYIFLGGISSLVMHMSAMDVDWVTMPDASELTARLEARYMSHFVETTNIVSRLANGMLRFQDIDGIVNESLDSYFSHLKNNNMDVRIKTPDKTDILLILLNDYPRVCQQLREGQKKGQGTSKDMHFVIQ